MKISFCTIAFQKNKWGADRRAEKPLCDILPLLADCRYDGVEILDLHVRDQGPAELAATRRQLDELGLRAAMIAPYLNFASSDEHAARSLAEARQLRAIAGALGAAGIRVFTGGNIGSAQATPEQWQRVVHCLQTLADEAPLNWVLEIHARNLMDTLDSTLRLLDDIRRPNVGVIYHPSNLGPSYLEAIDALGGHIRHVHATNSRDGQPTGLADGALDYRQISERLRRVGYAGYLSVEWLRDDAATVARREAEYLRSLL